MTTTGKWVKPEQEAAHRQRRLKNQLRNDEYSSQLVIPTAHPASPYGGAGAPSAYWYIPVTTGTFDGTQASQPWTVNLDRVVHRAVKLSVPWTTDGGTSGEMRLNMPSAPNTPTSAVALATASSGVVTFKWLHGWPPWFGNDIFFLIEARRTGGAGNVNIGYPRGGALQIDPRECTVTG